MLEYFAFFILSLQLHAKNKYIFMIFWSYIMYVMHPCSLPHRIDRKNFQNSGFWIQNSLFSQISTNITHINNNFIDFRFSLILCIKIKILANFQIDQYTFDKGKRFFTQKTHVQTNIFNLLIIKFKTLETTWICIKFWAMKFCN